MTRRRPRPKRPIGASRSEPASAAGRAPAVPRHLAQCAHGLEAVLAGELERLGATEVEAVSGGCLFAADHPLACRATLWLRSAARVLEPVVAGTVRDADQLYQLARSARWEELVGRDRTFSVRAVLSRAPLSDRRFAALRVKDAVADRVRMRRGGRPDVERHDPDVPLRLIVRGREATIFRDLAGDSLHRRGYRPVQVKSPLSEAVAAGLLLLGGWAPESALLDPMCGSGTFVLEAASLAADRAPGLGRSFAAERFPDADASLWADLRAEARDRLRSSGTPPLLGTDRHPGAVAIAKETAKASGLKNLVRFRIADAATFEPPFPPAVVATNPPWGGRLETGDELAVSWRALGTFLRRCPGAVALVLSGAPELTRQLGLKASRRWPIKIAGFDARWLRYEMRRSAATDGD